MWYLAVFSPARLAKKKELLCRFALLPHSSSFDWQNSIHHVLHYNFSLPPPPAIITFHFFSTQGPVFSFREDNSCKAQPWCNGEMCLLLFHSWQFWFSHSCLANFLAAKKDAFSPETSIGTGNGASRVASAHLYCNSSLSQVLLEMCWEG